MANTTALSTTLPPNTPTTPRTIHRPEADVSRIDAVIDFHGTCKHCKHFHKNWAFPFSNTGHVRVKCERCTKDMFGLGRADTQYTLASVDSIPLAQVGTSSASDRVGCSNVPRSHSRRVQRTTSPDPPQDPQPLSEERNAPQEHNQPHDTEVSPAEMRDGKTPGRSDIRTPAQPAAPLGIQALKNLAYRPTLLGALHYVNIFGAGYGERYFERPREYSIFGWRLVLRIHPPTSHSNNGHDTTELDTAHPEVTKPSCSDRGPETSSPVVPESDDNANLHTTSAPLPAMSATGAPQIDRSDSSHVDLQENGGHRSDHLSQLRREKTLRRNALEQLACKCTRGCHCIYRADGGTTSERDSEDAYSNRARTPPNIDDVPSEPLVDRLTGEQYFGFSYLSNHLHDQPQPASHGSGSTVESGQSATWSQAPTLGSSNSVPLHPSRPRLNARSRSMPL